MLGAIAGDIIGSVYEWNNIKTTDFALFGDKNRFTDDTVLTVAVADSILNSAGYGGKLREYYHLYPDAGYGGSFRRWAKTPGAEPYNSWGNGSAMRVSPVGWAFESLDEVLAQAKKSAAVTHNHPEGIKGAQAVAAAVFMARSGSARAEIKQYITGTFGYKLDETIASIRENYTFDVSCQGSVPQAITAFLESDGFENAVRLAISLGGDSDTIACITGGLAEAYYKEIPHLIRNKVAEILDDRLNKVVCDFTQKFRSF